MITDFLELAAENRPGKVLLTVLTDKGSGVPDIAGVDKGGAQLLPEKNISKVLKI
jgi:hypothetical protein